MTTDILDKLRPPAIRVEALQPIPLPWRRWIEHTLARWGLVTVDNFVVRVSHLRNSEQRTTAVAHILAIMRCAGIAPVVTYREQASRK